MTTTLELITSRLDEPMPMICVGEAAEPGTTLEGTARQQVERVTSMVAHYGTVAFVYHDEDIYHHPGSAVAAIIPAALADELIKEGRIRWPLYTSMTVPAPR